MGKQPLSDKREVKSKPNNSIMKNVIVKVAKSWWARQALKFTTYVSGAAAVMLAKVQVTVGGAVIDPLSQENELAIAAGAAALATGLVELALSALAAKDAKKVEAQVEEQEYNNYR